MIRAGSDGFAVRMILADLAAEAKRPDAARFEFLLANSFDPTMVEPLQALYDLDHREKRETQALDWLRKIVRLDQHDRKAYRLLLEGLIVTGQFAEAKTLGEAAMFVDVENYAVHSLYATALSRTGDHSKAIFELESALLCEPKPPEAATLHARLAQEHLTLRNAAKAKAEQAEALRLDGAGEPKRALECPVVERVVYAPPTQLASQRHRKCSTLPPPEKSVGRCSPRLLSRPMRAATTTP